MWPVLIFIALICLVLVEAVWRERRYHRERDAAKKEFATRLIAQQRDDIVRAEVQRQTLFNSMIEGVLLVGAEGKIQLVNESLRRLFGLSSDVREQTLAEAFRVPELLELFTRLQTERSMADLEFSIAGPPPRHLRVSASVVSDDTGHPQTMIFLFHDLTQLRQLENTRREFVANVSHELRTPLSLIKGFVETLLGGAKDDPVLATKFLQTIEKHADRLTFLVDDLLTISRLESGQAVLNLQNVPVRELADRVVGDLQARAAERKVSIANALPAELCAQADADRLEQVFFNLLENAVKYGRECGSVVISGKSQSDHLIEISVRDNGQGIPLEAQPRLFERFYRVDRARSPARGGTGLGLAIVKHIVQAHGGEVRVESSVGHGASFFLTLPSPPETRV